MKRTELFPDNKHGDSSTIDANLHVTDTCLTKGNEDRGPLLKYWASNPIWFLGRKISPAQALDIDLS